MSRLQLTSPSFHGRRTTLTRTLLICTSIGLGLTLSSLLFMAMPAAAAINTCFAEITGDNTTDFSSTDASAVRSALAVAATNSTVKLAGTCAGAITQTSGTHLANITKTLTLAGGYTITNWNVSNPISNPTVLDAQNGGRVLLVSAAGKLDGLTIKNGKASDSKGGGVYASTSLTLSRMTFSNNSSVDMGGAAYIEGDANMTGTVFTSNTAGSGGGAYVQGAASISNSTFVSNVTTNHAGGLDVEGNASISATLFQSNTTEGPGGGAYFGNGATLIRNNFISNQSTNDYGGGARLIGEPSLSANAFLGNRAGEAGGGLAQSGGNAGSIANNLFAGNTGSNGAGMYINTDGFLQVMNNTVASSTLASGAGIYVGGGTIAISNTIIASHTIGIDVPYGIATENYNLFSDNTIAYYGNLTAGANSITATASFTAPISNDYHLLNGSAGLNAGANVGLTSDYDGERRPLGSGYDIGYDEAPFPASVSLTNTVSTPLGSDTDFTATLTNAANFSYVWDFGDGSTANNSAIALTHLYVSAGNYTARITATNGISTLVASSPVIVATTPQYCFAEYTGDNSTDYSSTDASAVRHAIAAANIDGVVKVAGTCAGVSTVNGGTQVAIISKTLTLQGGYTNTNWTSSDLINNPTTLDAQNTGRVLSVTVDATIQGLTLTQGYVKGTELDRNGGVILAQSALTISDVTVYSNTTNANGAVYVGGTVVVANSTFYSNSAIVGGGLYAAASAYITKSQFVLNNSNVGGGLYAAHTLEVSDTSFMTNSAVVGGGLYSLSSTQLSQVSFISNTAIVGGGMQSAGPTRLSNTTFRLNSATVGGGAQLLATSEIQDSNFLGNIGTARGGGLALMGASAITDTTFIENSAEIGGATDIYRRTDMLRVTFSGNRASISGVAVFADAVSVTNTQFISNQTLYGGIAVLTGNTSGDRTFSNVLFADSVATGINGAALSADTGQNILLMHVTIAASSPNTATAIYLDNAQMWLTNTLIANYDTGILRGSGSVTDTSTLFSDVNMPYSGTIASSNSHSITGTATFVDAVNGNFHLVSGSAGINMGTDAGLSEDYDGDLRPQGGGYDIGYDETDAVGTLSLTASETLHVGDLTTFTATVGNAIVYSYTWDLGDGTVNTTTAGSLYTDMSNNGHIYPSGRGYTVIVTATTNIGELTTSVFVHAGSLACFAETTGDNVTDYLSSDASALRDAIAAANEGGTVKLAGLCAGATTEDGTTQVSLITKTLTVQGGFSNTDWFTYDPSANPTTVDAAAQGRVIYATVDVTLQGFTVTQGATTFVGAGVLADNNLTLTDMTLYSNTTAQSGGGAWVTGRLFMNKSTVISNTAKYQGGGIASIEAATISDSELISNTADMSDGGGLFADGYITLTRILFTANSAGLKGGAVIGNSGGSIVSNTFTANQASVGGAMVLAGAADTTQVLTSTFERNSSTEIGGAIYLEAASEPYHSFITATRFVRNSSMSGGTLSIGNGVIATVDNGLFVHNSASEGPIDIEVSGSTVPASLNARHNTFVNTDGVAIEAGDAIDGDQAYITNSIFSGYDYPLQIGPQQADMVADGMLIYDVNDAQLGDRITITHIYKADPAFIDPSSDNYHITPASTALNTGVPTQVATDADGDMRPQGGGVDLGYDETEDRVLFSASNSGDTLLGNTTTFTATLHAGAGFDFALDFGDGVITTPVDSSFNPQQMILSHTYASVGTYAAVITASNSFTTLAASVPVKVGVLSCYAEVTGDNVTDFNSIDASAVRSAIAAADEGGTIKIAGTCAGVANENQTNQVVYISKTLALQGGYTHTNWTISDPIANPTILDAQQGGRVIYANAAVSLQGFTVTHGLALNGGGGIYATRPITLTSIGIIENTSVAIGGGGAYLNGSASLSNTVCMSNTATNGDAGGIYFNEMASVESSVFSGNSAATGWAGGANFQSSSLITNSVFSHNISIIGGGAVLVWENTTAKSRFIGNSAERGGAIAMAKSSAKKRLINVLFAENTATSKGAAIHIERGELIEIIHSTLANATMQTGASIYVEDGTTMISNTLISSHTIGIQKVHGTVTDSHTLFSNVTKPYSGTIAIDPNSITGTAVFIDSASGNYHLETGSAGINASDLSVLGVTEDTDGELRPQGVGYDIGYDETPYRATLIANNDGPQLLGNTVQLSATLGNGAGFTYTWNFGNGTNSAPSGLSVSHIYTSTGRYTATIVADNALGSLSASTVVEVIALPTATATATATPTSTTTTTPTPTATQTPMPTQSATATTVEATQTAKPTAMPTATATSVSSPVPSATSTSTPMTPLNQQQFMPLLLS